MKSVAVLGVVAVYVFFILPQVYRVVMKEFYNYVPPLVPDENVYSRGFLLEIVTALLLISFIFRHGLTLASSIQGIFLGQLILLAIIDFRYYLLPDMLTLTWLWLGLLVSALGFGIATDQAIFAASIGYSSLWLVNSVFKKIRGQDGLGQGDYKLFAAMGAWLGCGPLLTVLTVAASLGSLIGLIMVFHNKHGWDKPLPFGVFLVIGAYVEMLFNASIC